MVVKGIHTLSSLKLKPIIKIKVKYPTFYIKMENLIKKKL
jgi:hypothetical protein